jgi:hypothetical protein
LEKKEAIELPTKPFGYASSDIFTEYYSEDRVKRASVMQQKDSSAELIGDSQY